ncbi:hypothetical protein V495_01398, partial [Pseudogymnoascus sp. VKM F-4514 (FW-929)]
TATYTAGSTYDISLTGSATHSGGSCQLSLSYDNGATFKVIKSMLGGCPLTSKYDFVVPAEAPNGPALLAWTWFNLSGNREMYMNCVDVEVINGAGNAAKFNARPNIFVANVNNGCATVEGKHNAAKFNARPNIFVANVNNGCATVEGKHTVFANLGDAVIYGSGVTSTSPVFPKC